MVILWSGKILQGHIQENIPRLLSTSDYSTEAIALDSELTLRAPSLSVS